MPPLRARTGKQVIQEMAERAGGLSGLPASVISEAVRLREQLGPTGVGGGVAIPHAKIKGVGKIFGVVARVEKPVEFQSRDGAPVDLFFMLIAPESAGAEHLKALSRVARVLHNTSLVNDLRAAQDAAALYMLLTRATDSRAA